MTDEVARLVLRDNIEQNVALSVARAQASAMLPVHRRLMAHLERQGDLDRALEFLPDDEELDQRAASGHGLTSPELSVLLAYAKITNTAQLLQSDLADASWFERVLRAYFLLNWSNATVTSSTIIPAARDRYHIRRKRHDQPCRDHLQFPHPGSDGCWPDQIARAYTVARKCSASPDSGRPSSPLVCWQRRHRYTWKADGFLDRVVRWLLQSRQARLDVAAEISRFQPQVADLTPRIPEPRARIRAGAAACPCCSPRATRRSCPAGTHCRRAAGRVLLAGHCRNRRSRRSASRTGSVLVFHAFRAIRH